MQGKKSTESPYRLNSNPRHRQPFLQQSRVGQHRGVVAAVHHCASVEHHRALGDGQDQPWVLLDDDDVQAFFFRHARNGAQQLFHDDGRQAFKGLVEQQQLGVQHQGAGHGQHLLFAAGQLVAKIAFAFGQTREQLVSTRHVPWARARHGGEVFFHR